MGKCVLFSVSLALVAGLGCSDDGNLSKAREFCLRPEGIDFGEQTVRTVAVHTMAVTSCGGRQISEFNARVTCDLPEGVAPEDAPPCPYLVEATTFELPLEPGEHFLLPIRFRPLTAGTFTGNLEFRYTETEDPVAEAPVSGTGVDREICDPVIDVDGIDFPQTQVGQTVQDDFTITNNGQIPCLLSGARVTVGHASFSVVTSPAATLAPGDATTITVEFSPQAGGATAGEVAVVASEEQVSSEVAVNQQLTVPLTGNGGDTCALVADPNPVNFPRAQANIPSSATSGNFLLRNVGVLDCTLDTMNVSAGAEHFIVTTAPNMGTVMANGVEEPVEIKFAPLEAGARSGTLSVTTVEGPTLDVVLSGFADATPVCSLRFEPTPIAFDPLAVGLSEEILVTATNNSVLDCDIQGSQLSAESGNDFTLVTPPATGVLHPGEMVDLTVRFSPQAASLALGEVVIDLGDSDIRADLIGFGDFADLKLTPLFDHHGIVTEGCASHNQDVLLTNVGPVAAFVEDLIMSPTTDPNFFMCFADCGLYDSWIRSYSMQDLLGPNESVTIETKMHGEWGQVRGHYGEIEVHSVGNLNPTIRNSLYGETESVLDANRTDVFVQSEQPTVDILFVVDNSGSMGQEQTNLANNFDNFINVFLTQNIDFHIGVTTTDTTWAQAGELVAPCIHPGSVDIIGEFMNAVNVGTTGSASEKGLLSSSMAIPNLVLEQCGDDPLGVFLRENSLFSVIYVSDEEDQSPGAVADYVDDLMAAKGYQPGSVIASAIAGDVPAGCNANGNNADSGDRYLAISIALGGVFGSICASDWAVTLEAISMGVFTALTNFSLSRTPDANTIEVEVCSGTPEVCVDICEENTLPGDCPSGVWGWRYSDTSNTVVLLGLAMDLAQPGDTVAISYTAECVPQLTP